MIKDRIEKFCQDLGVDNLDQAIESLEKLYGEAFIALSQVDMSLGKARNLFRLRDCSGCRHSVPQANRYDEMCLKYEETGCWVGAPKGSCPGREDL